MKKVYGVIGDPIGHSMSPVMHNDLFEHNEIDATYLAFHVKKGNLEAAVTGLKALGVSGFNVTVPHKTDIIPLLDDIDPLAKAIGAVNTVVNTNGKLIGFNTDGRGFVRALLNKGLSLTEQKVLVIGAGGAARAIYFSLAEAGVKEIDICNRTVEKALSLKEACPFSVETKVSSISEAEKTIVDYDLLIQTTLIGMSPQVDDTPIRFKALKTDCFASDIIYNPLETKFLKEAKFIGASIQNGVDMFVNQGALAFEIWTSIFPDTNRMTENVLKQLGGSSC